MTFKFQLIAGVLNSFLEEIMTQINQNHGRIEIPIELHVGHNQKLSLEALLVLVNQMEPFYTRDLVNMSIR